MLERPTRKTLPADGPARWRQTAAVLAAGSLLATPPALAATPIERTSLVDASAPRAPQADFSGEAASGDARQVAAWVMGRADNAGRPFVIVDKKAAKVFVFDARGRLLGATPALLGLARGDESAPGIGNRKLSQIRPDERTTPAGRFVASLGHALGPQDVLWVDYGAALALHRVLAVGSRQHRLERLAAADPNDARITFGCINVPAPFFDRFVHPNFSGAGGVVYILPEVKSIAEVFGPALS